jgi:16S rRNA (uracil1498-N3)-methyltransferase
VTSALFHLDPIPAGPTLQLTGPEGRHAATVRRIAIGEQVDVSDGRGGLAHCTVVATARDEVTLTLLDREQVPAPTPRLVVAQALIKGDRAEHAVEMLVEAGADEIVPWVADRSIAKWPADRAEKARSRWQATAREAAKQSRRPWWPEIGELTTSRQLARRLADAVPVVLHESATDSLSRLELGQPAEVVLVIGPEGGITDAELAAFGGHPYRLGPSVLRSSTAGTAALAVLQARLGRW